MKKIIKEILYELEKKKTIVSELIILKINKTIADLLRQTQAWLYVLKVEQKYPLMTLWSF